MRLATWNINGMRARLAFFLHWLKARRPDIVGLQELKLTDQQFPHAEIEAAGYTAVTHGQKGWNGVAIVSKSPATVTCAGLPGQEDQGARFLTARVADLSFTTVYAPNGKSLGHEDFPRKLAWFDGLLAHLGQHHSPDEPMVLCGDLNICPAPIDSWNEETLAGSLFHTDEERRRFGALTEWGLCDLFRHLHPDARAYSWWDYRGGAFHRRQGLRIDFLLGNAGLAGRLRAVEIDRSYRKKQEGLIPSDHAPVMADLD